MANHAVKGIKYTTVEMNASNDTWTVDPLASVWGGNNAAIFESNARSGNTLVNHGNLYSDATMSTAAVYLAGTQTQMINRADGLISGRIGLDLEGNHQQLQNQGMITGSDVAVYLSGVGNKIQNDGDILSVKSAIEVVTASTITNGVHGHITGGVVAIDMGTATGQVTKIINNGLIESGSYAIGLNGGIGIEKVTNHGTIIGNVALGDGNDSFDNRGGVIKGVIYGGTGNDTLFTSSNAVKLVESGLEGDDTVKSTVSYKLNGNVEHLTLLGNANINGTGAFDNNSITGNAAKNVLKGLGGSDVLDGGKGDDTLTGGSDSDTFVFRTGSGKDTVTDFENGIDHFNLQSWAAIVDFNDLKAHHMTVSDGDIILHAGSDTLTIKNTLKSELDVSDFLI